jgi:hypothetical protein
MLGPSLGGVTLRWSRFLNSQNSARFRSHSTDFQETEPGSTPLSAGREKPGAVMWTLLAYGIAAILIPTIVVLALFRLAHLRRAEDLPPAYIDEWASSHELRTPK